jgi:hypothetical protein
MSDNNKILFLVILSVGLLSLGGSLVGIYYKIVTDTGKKYLSLLTGAAICSAIGLILGLISLRMMI